MAVAVLVGCTTASISRSPVAVIAFPLLSFGAAAVMVYTPGSTLGAVSETSNSPLASTRARAMGSLTSGQNTLTRVCGMNPDPRIRIVSPGWAEDGWTLKLGGASAAPTGVGRKSET